jgi:hypothetical protein
MHADFEFPSVEFQNFNETGITNGNVDGSYASIGTLNAEFVPPRDDSTVDTEGTHLDFSTSIRVPAPKLNDLDESLVAYGDDNERPTKVIAEGVGYEVQAVINEHGSDMRLIRLTED